MATAVVGRVSGPVSAAGSLPGDGDADADPEHPREHSGGQFRGESGTARSSGPGPGAGRVGEAVAELVGADRPARPPAGEQPARGSLVAEGGLAPAMSDEMEDEGVEWIGQNDGLAAEAKPYLLLVGLDMVEGEAADGGDPLGIEQNEQPGDAVLGFDGVVVEQPAGLLPSGLGVDDPARPVPSGGREVQAGQLLSPCPADEVPGLAALAACSLVSQVSRSPCRAVARVRSRAVSQSSSVIAALTCR